MVRDAAALRHRIGLAGQYAAVDENLTGLENLTMVGRLYGASRAAAKRRGAELLERFELSEAGGRVTSTYSGGMRRRLDLAAALVAKPPVVFLDEPTTGLDPRSRIALWETIEALVSEGTTVLLTTQYLDEADRLADSITVIDHGLVIASGTSDELKDRVGGERVEVVLEDAADAERAVAALAAMSAEAPAAQDGRGQRAGARAPRGHRRGGGAALHRERIGMDDINLRRPTLDDVFLSLTGHAAEEPTETAEEERGMRRLVTDTLIIAERNLIRLPRKPELLLAFTVQPIMFVLLFRYVFGGAINTGGVAYVDYPDPRDHRPEHRLRRLRHRARPQRGRAQGPDRPLPLAADGAARGAGRPDAGGHRHQLHLGVRAGDHRPDHRLLVHHARCCTWSRGFALLLLIGYAFSWVFALVGLLASTPESANSVGFIAIFPLTFISSAFVPTASMPGVLGPSPTSIRSRSSSTPCARCGSGRRPTTTCGARWCGRW